MRKNKIIKIGLTVIGISCLFVPQIVAATDYYVDFSSGVNSADCTNTGSPCRDFNAPGLGGVTAGDNVNCTGTYGLNPTDSQVLASWSGVLGNPVSIQAWSGQSQPIIDASANPAGFPNIAIGFIGQSVVFDGFEVKSAATSAGATIYLLNPTDMTISNNIIHSESMFGIYSTDSIGLNITNNEIYNNQFGSIIQNSSLTDSNLIINANEWHNNSFVGIAMEGIDSPLLKNNFIYDNHIGIMFGAPGPGPFIGVENSYILNNSFYNNNNGLFVQATSTDSTNTFKNNIAQTTNSGQYILFDNTSVTSGFPEYFFSLDSDYNDFYIGASDYIASFPGPGGPTNITDMTQWQSAPIPIPPDTNSIASNPQYLDLTPGSIDLRIENTSPCKNAGTDLAPLVTHDIDGTLRPQDTAYDIGGYEILGTPSPGTPTNVAASNITKTSANISWDAASLATKYDVEYSLNSDMSGSSTKSVSSTNTTLSGLDDGEIYYVRVRGKYYSGGWITGSWSSKINFSTYISAPINFEVSNIKPKKAKFSWTYSGATALTIPDTHYILEVSTRSDFKNPIIVENIENKYYTAKELLSSKHYYARVKTTTLEFESDWSEVIDFRTIPKKPKIKRVERYGDIGAYVVFKKIPRVKEMTAKVLKKTANGWSEKYAITYKKKNFKNSKLRVDNLTPGIKYKVRVRGTWKTSEKGPYHGKWAIGKTFEL
ncbi:right-handed parallel beta-helix repeat-containing protein [Patescibacteria group bacterium]|nr:right-handed parallel beta-helix repeat-containing protein [Patescibacteria group bacterium]MBU1673641.1 right-handed parallel beta-helix repeat-containing protein [Patescibacteria group bacterium]MBU1963871.1 right-handed parallel beta-helix repeat-containing protein [Patescibacteria group bacterium]